MVNQHKKILKTLLYGFVAKVKVRYLKNLNNSFLESEKQI